MLDSELERVVELDDLAIVGMETGTLICECNTKSVKVEQATSSAAR